MVEKLEWKEIDGKKWFKFNKKFNEKKYQYGNLLTLIFILVLIALGGILYPIIMNHLDLLQTNPCKLCQDFGYICYVNPFG